MGTFQGLLACPLAAMLTPEPAQPLLHTLALSPCEAHCPWALDQETPLGLLVKPGGCPRTQVPPFSRLSHSARFLTSTVGDCVRRFCRPLCSSLCHHADLWPWRACAGVPLRRPRRD